MYYYDSSADGAITATLRYSNLSTGSYEMARAVSETDNYGSAADPTISEAAVDNQNRAYLIVLELPATGFSGVLNFKAIAIAYEYIGPY